MLNIMRFEHGIIRSRNGAKRVHHGEHISALQLVVISMVQTCVTPQSLHIKGNDRGQCLKAHVTD